MYHVEFSKKALNDLKKLDKHVSGMILGWVSKNLEGCENPRVHGKALVANQKGKWRYRVGDYRLICQIKDKQVLVLVLTVGHRKEIYK